MTKEVIKKLEGCPKCGENKFSVIERTFYNAEFHEGQLDVGKCFENETESIHCDNCGLEIKPEEVEIEYTW